MPRMYRRNKAAFEGSLEHYCSIIYLTFAKNVLIYSSGSACFILSATLNPDLWSNLYLCLLLGLGVIGGMSGFHRGTMRVLELLGKSE